MTECKRCSRCAATKPLDQYRMLKSGRLTSHCTSCAKAYLAAWRIKNADVLEERRRQKWADATPEDRDQKRERDRRYYPKYAVKQRSDYLVKTYGITLAEYTAMSVAQGGLCAICRSPCPTGRQLAVDHDHETGSVRGLLCANCNRGLGLFQDRANTLTAAAEYLVAHQSVALVASH